MTLRSKAPIDAAIEHGTIRASQPTPRRSGSFLKPARQANQCAGVAPSITVVVLGIVDTATELLSYGLLPQHAPSLLHALKLSEMADSVLARSSSYAEALEIVESIVAVGFRSSILLVGPWKSRIEIATVLSAGATDCIEEPFNAAEVAARIVRDWRGRQLLLSDAEEVLETTEGRPRLTNREKDIFLLALRERRVTFSQIQKEILRQGKVEKSTLHRAMERLRVKLGHYGFDLKSIPGVGFELRRTGAVATRKADR